MASLANRFKLKHDRNKDVVNTLHIYPLKKGVFIISRLTPPFPYVLKLRACLSSLKNKLNKWTTKC